MRTCTHGLLLAISNGIWRMARCAGEGPAAIAEDSTEESIRIRAEPVAIGFMIHSSSGLPQRSAWGRRRDVRNAAAGSRPGPDQCGHSPDGRCPFDFAAALAKS